MMIATIFTSCRHSQQQVEEGDEDLPAVDTLIYSPPTSDTKVVDTVATPAEETTKEVKPQSVDYYDKGYSVGFDNGREDAVMDLGEGWSYNDSNPYTRKARRDFERGYRKGYRDGYDDGFYNYSYGDEDEYDEYN